MTPQEGTLNRKRFPPLEEVGLGYFDDNLSSNSNFMSGVLSLNFNEASSCSGRKREIIELRTSTLLVYSN